MTDYQCPFDFKQPIVLRKATRERYSRVAFLWIEFDNEFRG